MNKAQSAVGTDDAEQSIPETSLSDELLELAKNEGHEVVEKQGEPKAEKQEEPKTEVTEPEPEEKPKQEDKPEELKPAAEKPKDDEPEKDEWPSSAKARVAEETAKRKARTEERDKAIEEVSKWQRTAAELHRQVQELSAPRPTHQNPLANVFDEPSLQKAENHYEQILTFAKKNRDGAFDVVVGKDEQGNPKKVDYTPEQIAEMEATAERVLRRDIPERRGYLAERAKADAVAMDMYPELKDPQNPFTQNVLQLYRAIMTGDAAKSDEILAWAAHAIKGRDDYLKEYQSKAKPEEQNLSEVTKKILAAPKIPPAPATPSGRSRPEPRISVDKKAALKTHKDALQRGDQEAALAYLDETGFGGASRKQELVNA